MAVSKSKKMVAGLALAGTAGVGGLAVAALNPLGAAGAASNPSTTVVANQQAGPQADQRGPQDGHGPQKVLKDVLDSLVKDGTITQAQADKITSSVATKVNEERSERDANRQAKRQEFLTTAAKAIGVSTTDLEAQLKSGTTLADVAKANNVDPNTVVVALVNELNTKIDADVASGKLTAEQGTARKAKATERVTDMVNNGPRHGGKGGPGGRHGGRGGMGGPGMGAPDGPPPADGQAPTTEQGGN
jgi:polyhydroxyalkanoate synthesis regulator phasin